MATDGCESEGRPEEGLAGESELAGGGRSLVTRAGEVIYRPRGPGSIAVLDLLRFLERQGFDGSPRVVEPGLDSAGREMLRYLPGVSPHPHAWPPDQLPLVGDLIRRLHDLTADYVLASSATWQPWFGRSIGDRHRVIGHGDAAPWNFLWDADQNALRLIDWETAGPVDPIVELAQVVWLNAQLHDDDVADLQGLASPPERAAHARAIVDGYGLAAAARHGLVDLMVEVAVQDAADQARSAGVTAETDGPAPLWSVVWRTRSASWMLSHRRVLETAMR